MSRTKMGMTIIEFIELYNKMADEDSNFRKGFDKESIYKNNKLLFERYSIGDRICKELYGLSLEDAGKLIHMLKNLHIEDVSTLCGSKVKKQDVKDLLVSTKKLDKEVNKNYEIFKVKKNKIYEY